MSNSQNLKSLLKSWILLEATRYKKETRTSAERWQEKLIRYEKAGGFFVHFSTIPRMGLFTRNKFGTPIGFYVYPLNREKMRDFAVERPYALIIKPKPEVRPLDFQTYSEDSLAQDIQKLIGLKYSKARIKTASDKAKNQSPGGMIWNITRVLSGADKADAFLKKVGKDPETNLPLKGGGPTGTWTMLLRRLGYDGVIDEGRGIIHPEEPYQAVFFDTTKLELVEVLEKRTDIPEKDYLFSPNYSERKDLKGKDFSRADLEKANFHAASLKGANFRAANAQEADFSLAVLSEADLSWADFSGADFSGANLLGASMRKSDFTKANFSGADLSKTISSFAIFTEALYDSNTVFIAGFRPERFGMVKTD